MGKLVAKERESPPACFYHWTAATSTDVPVCNSCAMYEAMQADIGRISVAGMSCIQVTTVVKSWKSDVPVPSFSHASHRVSVGQQVDWSDGLEVEFQNVGMLDINRLQIGVTRAGFEIGALSSVQ